MYICMYYIRMYVYVCMYIDACMYVCIFFLSFCDIISRLFSQRIYALQFSMTLSYFQRLAIYVHNYVCTCMYVCNMYVCMCDSRMQGTSAGLNLRAIV